MNTIPFKTDSIQGTIATNNNSLKTVVSGQLQTPVKGTLFYQASSPPDFRESRAGSGLPFPSRDIAFSNTPNVGMVELVNGSFTIVLSYPNSYYDNLANLVLPEVEIIVNDTELHRIPIGPHLVPNRSLSSLPNRPNRTSGR